MEVVCVFREGSERGGRGGGSKKEGVVEYEGKNRTEPTQTFFFLYGSLSQTRSFSHFHPSPD